MNAQKYRQEEQAKKQEEMVARQEAMRRKTAELENELGTNWPKQNGRGDEAVKMAIADCFRLFYSLILRLDASLTTNLIQQFYV